MLLSSLFVLCGSLGVANAQITVYGQIPLGQTMTPTDPNAPAATTLAAYNNMRLIPPPVPVPPPARAYTLSLPRDAASMPGLSVPHVGPSFWGFSIEMSVISQVLGRNSHSSYIQVPWLNLMANLQERSGGVLVRLGGNTQEFAKLVEEDDERLAHGHYFGKVDSGTSQTTRTPAVLYTVDMFYMAANISSMLNVKWFLGIPFNDSVNWRLDIAEKGQEILGDNLLGLQAGNEPDFYVQFKRRPEGYTPADYSNEVENIISVIDANPRIPNKHMLIGPSISRIVWQPNQVWETGFIPRFRERLYCLTMEHYPHNNCVGQYGGVGVIEDPQLTFPYYLSHAGLAELVSHYYESTALAVQAQLPMIMFETNTASCGGFPGISDSYGAALWILDYGMQMAWANFTHGMLHVGGQNVFYNPFTSPPTNQTSYNQWTVGSIYYSTIVLAEAFGKSNTSRIVDLGGNDRNVFTPSYAIYERDVLSKVALFNYVDDNTGASDLSVTVTVPGGGVPASVRVKYLAGDSVSTKTNITWAGQTLGNQLDSDGRFRGDLNITTINCNTGANQCVIPVPSPGFALVFFETDEEAFGLGQATQTFSTSARTQGHNTVTVDLAVMATSNGHSGMNRDTGFGSTSVGSVSAAGAGWRGLFPGLTVLGAVVGGAWFVIRAFAR
ncbi:glycoside hydrolase family 79 protein [Crassisporium funariophilum]|nr:glycoside hydrolase family 79 protein [Crassisporium funariophilum]